MIRFEIRELFFDTQMVRARVDVATRRVLSRFGAFVRRSARQSIRPRKSVSTPGSPPSSHTGLLKKFIFFGYDPDRQSVVIGPQRLNQNHRGDAPHLLEHGGLSKSGPSKSSGQRHRYRARPFMGPAFEKEQPKLAAMWRDSIK